MKKTSKYLALAVIIGSLFCLLSPALNRFERRLYDMQVYLHGAQPVPEKILLFAVEPADYPKLMAFLEKLTVQHVQAVGLDLPQFLSQYREPLLQLAQRQSDLPLVLASRFQYRELGQSALPYRYEMPPEGLQEHFKVGFANYQADRDSVVRQLPYRQVYRAEKNGQALEVFSLVWQLFQLMRPGGTGEQRLIRYLGPAGSFRIQPFAAFDATKDVWRERILILAEAGEPTQPGTPFQSAMPKLEIHAHALSSLMSGRAVREPAWLNLILPLLLAVLTVFFALPFLKWGLFIPLLSLVALASLYVVAAVICLNRLDLWLHVLMPLGALTTTWMAIAIRFNLTEGRQRRQLETTFRRHLPEKTVRRLLERDEASTLTQNERRVITVMFADITGFSKMGEKLPPDRIMRILNEYLTAMTEIIFSNQGTLDKYIGDGIMAVYGNIGKNNPREDAYRAVKTALEMQEEMERLQHKWMHEGLRPIQIRVGLNTGDALVGYVGHEKRKEVTVIGDAVNTAARLEQLNKQYQTNILVSQTTYEYVREWIESRPIGDERLKGKSSTIFVYEIKGWKSKQTV